MSVRPSTHLAGAIDLTRTTLPLAVVPALASLLEFSKVAAMAAPRGGLGVTVPLPTGLPTLWTFVNATPLGGGAVAPAMAGAAGTWLPLFLVGLVFTAALEAGFLGVLVARSADRYARFLDSSATYFARMLGINLLTLLVFVVGLPLLVFPPLAFAFVLVAGYLLYGLPFVVVIEDATVLEAVGVSIGYALDGGEYLAYAVGYLAVGTVGSVVLTAMVYNFGLVGILVGAVIVAVPALFVTAFGVVVFRSLRRPPVPPIGH